VKTIATKDQTIGEGDNVGALRIDNSNVNTMGPSTCNSCPTSEQHSILCPMANRSWRMDGQRRQQRVDGKDPDGERLIANTAVELGGG
jgi:hypothetical protein